MFPIRVVQIERRTTGTVTSLGASTLLEEKRYSGEDIADMYFKRWPSQEANFRAVNQAVGLKDVHGYGKRLVDNISVISRLEKLGQSMSGLEEKVGIHQDTQLRQEAKLDDARRLHDEVKGREAAASAQLGVQLATPGPVTAALRKLAKKQRASRTQMADQAGRVERAERSLDKTAARLERTQARLERHQQEAGILDERREIFENDVDLDSLFTLLKVGLVFLVTYALREFFGGAAMAPATFLARIATLPARLRLTPQLEIVTFDYNVRDPDAMAMLSASAAGINARKLTLRSGKVLRVDVDPPPPTRPPPAQRRTKSARWKTG